MKKFLVLSVFALSILSLSACGKQEAQPQSIKDTTSETKDTTIINSNNDDDDCAVICKNALQKCNSLKENDCLSQCQNATNVEKACLKNFNTCDELARKCRYPSNSEKQNESINNCTDACNNYVLKCISQVPNATEALQKDAYDSCMGECAEWNFEKINCMSISPSCEAFTNQCGL